MKKPRSRANGEGTIYNNGTSWVAQYTDPSANRHSKSFPSQRKAQTWLTQQKREMDTGEWIEPSEMPLGVWWDKWVDVYKRTVASKSSMSTYTYSRKRLERVDANLLQMSVSRICSSDVQKAINAMHDSGLSDRTCELTLVHLRDCFKRALFDRMTRFNPAINVMPPSTHSKAARTVKTIPDEEFDKLIAELKRPLKLTQKGTVNEIDLLSKAHRDAILFILRTAVRRGEACALKWSDINFTTQEATIGRSLDAKLNESQTKTEEVGTVPLSPDVVEMLRSRMFNKHEFVFANQDGKPISPRNLLRTMQKIIPDYNIHSLRKTYCTRAARAGINPKVLQTITRHKSIQVLLKYYTGVSAEDKAEANANISSYCKSTANK